MRCYNPSPLTEFSPSKIIRGKQNWIRLPHMFLTLPSYTPTSWFSPHYLHQANLLSMQSFTSRSSIYIGDSSAVRSSLTSILSTWITCDGSKMYLLNWDT